jgi:hypothetical protein
VQAKQRSDRGSIQWAALPAQSKATDNLRREKPRFFLTTLFLQQSAFFVMARSSVIRLPNVSADDFPPGGQNYALLQSVHDATLTRHLVSFLLRGQR